jgi:hypothetical protein
MPSTLDLLDLPYTFWQLRLLTEDQFRREAKARGVDLFERQLEGLHRLRVLLPFVRVSRDGRAIAAAARRDDPDIWEIAHWQSTHRVDLLRARDTGRIHDPLTEHFIARRRLGRKVGDVTYRSSEYLYSHHQLLSLPVVQSVLPSFRYSDEGEINGFEVDRAISGYWQGQAEWLHPRLIALSALEPIYYPNIIRRIRYNADELASYDAWRNTLRPRAMLDWLEVEPSWIKDSAGALLDQANRLDPLGQWSELVREADPDRWDWLQGEARSANDLRIGAEILLRYYDRLVRGRIAPKIKEQTGRMRDQFSGRLKPKGGLDGVLTSFGLSPHPQLVLVVEGETELLLFPRLMALFGTRKDRNFIAIENAQGVGRDISSLVAFAVAPSIERDANDRYLRPLKPLTRLLAVMDAEGKYATPQSREERRRVWVDRILQTLPPEDRTSPVRRSIERLVAVKTWNRKGQSFEFAHFTDRQLAVATAKIDRRTNLSLEKRVEMAESIRRSRGNLDPLLGSGSKVELADVLWPVLRRRVERAQGYGTERRIPIVRMLDHAIDMAHELPRRNVVIPRLP